LKKRSEFFPRKNVQIYNSIFFVVDTNVKIIIMIQCSFVEFCRDDWSGAPCQGFQYNKQLDFGAMPSFPCGPYPLKIGGPTTADRLHITGSSSYRSNSSLLKTWQRVPCLSLISFFSLENLSHADF
jgi:hypothetical protein